MQVNFINGDYVSLYEECDNNPRLWELLYSKYMDDLTMFMESVGVTFNSIRKNKDVCDDFILFLHDTNEGEILTELLSSVEEDFLVFYTPTYNSAGMFLRVEKYRVAYTTLSQDEMSELIVKYLKHHDLSMDQLSVSLTKHLIKE